LSSISTSPSASIDARGDDARRVRAQIHRLRPFARELERDLLQVEDDVGRILDHAADRLELVQHALDAHGGDRGALNRREQRAPQRIADGRSEAALKRLRGELSVLLGECFGVDGKTLGFLKTSPKHCVSPLSGSFAMHFAKAVCFGCTPNCGVTNDSFSVLALP
jgi:hypothetical protein